MAPTALGFLGVYILGICLTLFRHPLFGLYTYLWAFYIDPPGKWWSPALPNFRWSLTASLFTILAAARLQTSPTRLPWHGNWSARILIAYTAWMWLQSFWAINQSATGHLFGCILFTKYLALFYIMYRILSDQTAVELFSWGHVVGCCILGWIAYRTVVDGRLEGVGGPGIDDANSLGMHLTTGLAFAGFMFLSLRSKKRWVVFAAMPFILNGIILTESRGAFLGLLGAGFAAWYLKPRGYGMSFYGAGALAIVLFLMLANVSFWMRMDSITTDDSQMDASAMSRVSLIEFGWQMAKDHPWGVGYGGHEELSRQYLSVNLLSNSGTRAAHNTFMAILVEQGYPGAILYSALLVWVTILLFRLKALDKLGLTPLLATYRAAFGTAFAAWFVCSQFGNFLQAEVLIWLLALLAVLDNICQEAIRMGTRSPDFSA